MNCKRCSMPMMPVYSRRNGWQAACVRCGAAEAAEPVEGLSPEAARSAARGWNCYRLQEFDEALSCLTDAVEKGENLPEYLWAKLLAEYGVKYCEANNGQYTVNFWRQDIPEEPISESAEFRQLRWDVADELEELRSYTEAAEDVDRGLRQIAEMEGEPCDVFICFKERDAQGLTPERELCDGLYNDLTDRGLKVFYAPRTLAGKFTTDYEGYIYSALRSAKILLIVTSSRENVCSPWVESEWRRFQRWNAGQDYRLMTCMVGGMTPDDFPHALSRYQHVLRAELNQLQQKQTIGWIAGEVEKRCILAPARTRQEAKPAQPKPVEPETVQPSPVQPKPVEPETVQPSPVQPKPVEPEPAHPEPLSEMERLEARAKGGDAEAQYELGKCYFFGQGVAQDDAEAVKWYRLAAEQGHALAQEMMGMCSIQVGKDNAEAVKWFRQSAEQGLASAQCTLGNCYSNGEGVAQDDAEAVQWYRKAAEQGLAWAQYYLGNCYSNSKGVAQDYAEAEKWFRKAMAQGNTLAKRHLETLEEERKSKQEKPVNELEQLKARAEDGDAAAQYKLGERYNYGVGVEPDDAAAAKWYRQAAEQGHELAKVKLARLEESQRKLAEEEQRAEMARLKAQAKRRRRSGTAWPRSRGTPRRRTCWGIAIAGAKAWRETKRRR